MNDEAKAWMETARQESCGKDYYRNNQLALQAAMRAALNELGVPSDSYPAPVANAVELLGLALQLWGIVDGYARHADDCSGSPCKCTHPDEVNPHK